MFAAHRLALTVGLSIAACLAVAASAGATGDSGIDFADPAHDGQLITDQFAYQGVRFGKGADHGVSFAADCGAPMQVASGLGRVGASSARSAEAGRCGGTEFYYTGTFAGFDWPRKKVELWVGSSSTATKGVTMTAYDSAGTAIGATSVNAGQSASWGLAINHAGADISGVSIAFTNATDAGYLEVDDLVVDNSAAPLDPTPRTITKEVGQAFSGVVGHVYDHDPTAQPEDFTATIDWGDGQTSPATIVNIPGNGVDVTGSHSWTTAGDLPITVTVQKPAYGRQIVIASSAHVVAPGAGGSDDGGGATPPAPPAPGAPSAGPAASAQFVASAASVPRGHLASFDASGSVAGGAVAKQYGWDLNNDGKTDASCDGATPILQARQPVSGASTVKLTVTDQTGAKTSALQPFSVTASRPHRARAAGLKLPVGLSYKCKTATATTNDITAQGGPPAGCVTQVSFGIVDAVGCFEDASHPADIPFAERNVIVRIFQPLRAGGARAAASPLNKLSPTDKAFSTRDPVISHQPVRLNGLDIIPAAGAVVAIIPSDYRMASRTQVTGWIVSSNATVRVGSVPLQTGELRIRLPYGAKTAHVFDFDLKRDVPFLKDLPLTGGMEGDLVDQATQLPAHVMLPGVFTDPSTGKGLSAEVTLRATNRDGILLDGIEVHAPHVFLGGVALNNLFFRYHRAQETYEGGGEVQFPPNGDVISGSIGFKRGSFEYLKLAYDAGAGSNGIVLGPDVSMYHLGGAFRLDPTELDADTVIGMGVSAGGGCPTVGVRAALHLHFDPAPFVLDAQGHVELNCIPLSHGFLHIDGDGYISFGGGLDYDFAVFSLKAEVSAQFRSPHFQVDGNARACIGDLGCIGGEAVISDVGMGFCADFGFTHAGAGFFYPPVATFVNPVSALAGILGNASVMFTSCNVGKYRSLPKTRAAGQVGVGQTIEVTDPDHALIVGVVGAGETAQVKLSGPGGRVIQAPLDGPLRNANEVVFHNPADDTEYFLINKPAKGTWSVAPLDGSPALKDINVAQAVSDPKITASVTHHGRRYSLRYRWQPTAGQTAVLVEKSAGGERTLGVAKAPGATLSFSPSDARGNARTIVAQVALGGHPQANVDIARYNALPSRLARPSAVKARRVGKGVRVSWKAVAGASGYLVSARISDGRRLVLSVGANRRQATIAAVSKLVTVDVHVSALRAGGQPGAHSRIVHLNRVRQHPRRRGGR